MILAALAGNACDRGATADGAEPRDRRDRRDPAGEQAEFDRTRRPDIVIATIGLRPGEVVADVGAGTGLLTIHVAAAARMRPPQRMIAGAETS